MGPIKCTYALLSIFHFIFHEPEDVTPFSAYFSEHLRMWELDCPTHNRLKGKVVERIGERHHHRGENLGEPELARLPVSGESVNDVAKRDDLENSFSRSSIY